ncbi:MAG: hypothetical protein LBG11_07210, partial [Bifidobacteriaceae bacterium]|nr:hypothetical protein [Bifidobacteriaceae bacterium]
MKSLWVIGALAAGLAASGSITGQPVGGSDGDPGGDVAISVTIPVASLDQTPGGDRTVLSNAMLAWGFNAETRGKSYYGACNFLMAGSPGTDGNAGRAAEWSPGDWGKDLYHGESGNAKVVNSAGRLVPFERRCLDPAGEPLTDSTYTDTQVQLTGGSGWRDSKTGQARIEWDGTFTVVYYDGLTYFWVEDPV